MRRRHGWLLLASLMAGGCLSTPQQSLPLVPPQQAAPMGEGVAAAEAKELPPTETARVCIATAEALAQKGQDIEAIALYEKARKVDPKQQKLCRRLAVLYDRQDDYQKAMEEYAQAVQLYPRDAGLHNDLGYCHYCRGKWAEAEQALRKAVELDGTMKRAWINLGLCQAQQERYDDALTSFRKAVPEAQAHANIAFVLTAQGKTDAARGAYQLALKADPGLTRAGEALARLNGEGPPPAPPTPKGREVKGPVAKPTARKKPEPGVWPPPPGDLNSPIATPGTPYARKAKPEAPAAPAAVSGTIIFSDSE